MDRRGVIQMLYDKPRIAGFQFDKLWHPPMSYYISQQDVIEIYNISRSAKLNALPLKKYGMVDEILKRRGFTRLHAGTNRLVYKSEYDSSICLKIGIDIVGREANVGEYHTQELLKPFCTKVFEVTPCGTVAMVERVNPIKNRFQFEDVGDIIFNIIIMQFAGIVLEDVGTNFFMNWGIREGFGPVVLDFPYAYEADITKFVEVMYYNMKSNHKQTMLKRLRADAGLSQMMLAEKADVSIRQIQLFEQQKRDINKTSAETLEKLSKALNCKMEDLLEKN